MLQVAKVIGLNSDTDAALAYITSPQVQEGEEGAVFRLCLLISVSAEDAFSLTRQAISTAEDTFFSSLQSPQERLPLILDSIKQTLSAAENFEAIAAISQEGLSSDQLYLYYLGSQIKAYLVGHSQQVVLTELAPPGQLVSGVIKAGERVVLCTANFEELLGADFKTLITKPLSEFIEEGEARLSAAQAYQLAVVALDKEKEEEVEIIPSEKLAAVSSPAFSLNLRQWLKKGTDIQVIKEQLLQRRPRSLKGLIFLVGVILLIVWGGVMFNSRRQKEAQVTVSFEQSLVQATLEYQKAWSLKDADSALSSQSLSQAKTLLTQALQLKPHDQQALSLKQQIEENSALILKVFNQTDFALWMDLSLIKKDFSSAKFSLSLGNILLLDPQRKNLVKIDLSTKAPQLLAGEEKLGQAQLASLNGNTAWVFSADKGLISIDTLSGKSTVAIKPDPGWGSIADLYGFAGNVYLLDKGSFATIPSTMSSGLNGSGQVWKYLPVETGFTEKRAYLKEGTIVNFSAIKRMHIDSSIWLLQGESELLKYTAGSADYFVLTSLDQPLKEVKSFFVSDKTEKIYLLDRGNSRLVVVDKKGVYQTQYAGEKFATFDDLVVDEKNKKIYLLGDNKIFQIDLK